MQGSDTGGEVAGECGAWLRRLGKDRKASRGAVPSEVPHVREWVAQKPSGRLAAVVMWPCRGQRLAGEAVRQLRVVMDSNGSAEVVWKHVDLDHGHSRVPGLGQCGKCPVPQEEGEKQQTSGLWASPATPCYALGP